MSWKLPAPERNRRLILLCTVAIVLIVATFSFVPSSLNQFDSLGSIARVGGPSSPVFVREEGQRTEGPRVAICLVGGARRFELTGPTLLDRVVNVFNHSHLFLHVPLDNNTFKISLLRGARRIAAVKIYEQKDLTLTRELREILSATGSPKGLQGLIHYFKLVEGCVDLIDAYQTKNQFRYDWIVRTRLDSYWTGPLSSEFFIPATYAMPLGSDFLGLNDRLGIGDLNTSRIALSRFSVLYERCHVRLGGFRFTYRYVAKARAKRRCHRRCAPYGSLTRPDSLLDPYPISDPIRFHLRHLAGRIRTPPALPYPPNRLPDWRRSSFPFRRSTLL